ncbi:MAG: type II toxin-antitoxin system RelE/ParE family toxin [Pseudomonadales bacterium]|nr:type II toxin-antitoxin system RelE/ParE family toxin [Pseudomonadales bacterium]MCP5331253.1 type II toxin-antitoxin system RelE/ParE family toxin [Pseudomonadales bacterium]MCP5344894.1 type II toxin-antitoxin system RelE/ParE family toxin [Pseudomonadales bacterium]
MTLFRLSKKAKDDLLNIARYTERRWGRKQRRDYLLQLDNAFHAVAKNPELGRACSGGCK